MSCKGLFADTSFTVMHTVTSSAIPAHSHSEYVVSHYLFGPSKCRPSSRQPRHPSSIDHRRGQKRLLQQKRVRAHGPRRPATDEMSQGLARQRRVRRQAHLGLGAPDWRIRRFCRDRTGGLLESIRGHFHGGFMNPRFMEMNCPCDLRHEAGRPSTSSSRSPLI